MALAVGASASKRGAGSEIPTPRDFLGYDPIEEARAVGADQLAGYLRALDRGSDRVAIEPVGLSTGGRPLWMAQISSRENLLQSPGTAPPVTVLITCSIHADEVGPALMGLRLLYRLASSRTPGIERIYRNLRLLVFPAANPDGLDRVKKFAGEDACRPGPLPILYHRFTGHDINRDWTLLTQAEIRILVRIFSRWRPNLAIDVHQMGRIGPRLFLPPYAKPINPAIPRGLLRRADALGTAVREEMQRAGRTGIVSGAIFDAWTPARLYPFFHGAPRFLIEVASADLFRPVKPGGVDEPHPVLGGGGVREIWGIREIADYGLLAVESALRIVSESPGEWLAGDGETRGTGRSYFVPAGQPDPWAAREILEALRLGGAGVGRSSTGWTISAPDSGPLGLDGWLQTLLECTPYPVHETNRDPYDSTCHDLVHLAGLKIQFREGIPAGLEAQAKPLEVFPGSILPSENEGNGYLLDQGSLAVFRELPGLIQEGLEVRRLSGTVLSGGRKFPPGTFFLPGVAPEWIARIALEAGVAAAPAPAWVPATPVRIPRIGVCAARSPSMDEGWTRWILEDFRIPFQAVRDFAIDLDPIEVLVIPQGTFPRENPIPAGAGAAIRTFVSRGGRVVALGTSGRLISSCLKLPVMERRISGKGGVQPVPGTLLRGRKTRAGRGHPVLLGTGDDVPLFCTGGPFWEPGMSGNGSDMAFRSPRALLVFPLKDIALCGLLRDEKVLEGASPLVEVTEEKGSYLLFGFRPQFRGWTLGSMRIFLNALLVSPGPEF